MVKFEQSAEALGAPHVAAVGGVKAPRKRDDVAQPLVIPFLVKMLAELRQGSR